jgi:uncharacterized OB-fold protein
MLSPGACSETYTTFRTPAQVHREMNSKPVPEPTPESRCFWDKACVHELWLPKCVDSGRFFFPPRLFSPFTGGAITWERASGNARLASFVIAHRAAPGFEAQTPYIIALAELEEGPRLLTNLPGAPPDPAMLKIGAPLTVTFEVRGDLTIPQFQLANEP